METYIDNPKLEQNYIFSHSKTKLFSCFFWLQNILEQNAKDSIIKCNGIAQ